MIEIQTDKKSKTGSDAFSFENWHTTKFFLIIACVCIIVFACGNHATISKTERRKFIDTYVDLTLAYWKSERSPETYQSLAAAVYQKYDIDKGFLIKARLKIENNPKFQYGIYREIADRLKTYDDIPPDSLSKILNNAIDTR
jgi:hypothetical protein